MQTAFAELRSAHGEKRSGLVPLLAASCWPLAAAGCCCRCCLPTVDCRLLLSVCRAASCALGFHRRIRALRNYPRSPRACREASTVLARSRFRLVVGQGNRASELPQLPGTVAKSRGREDLSESEAGPGRPVDGPRFLRRGSSANTCPVAAEGRYDTAATLVQRYVSRPVVTDRKIAP